ncbi:hypothetical protein B5K06_25630 [Rhizobium grahamii]|uniref:Uncharacterized protein n=2 Tax=Rhizobium grahamii TaxID=1120045 RepID=A0A370KIT5_9HYPH|nr:hypothetical protein B5K06_25630 [Rhizobium grahamii]
MPNEAGPVPTVGGMAGRILVDDHDDKTGLDPVSFPSFSVADLTTSTTDALGVALAPGDADLSSRSNMRALIPSRAMT